MYLPVYLIFIFSAGCRFLSSFFVIAAATAGFVYTTEVVGRRYRTWFGLGNQILRAVGYISLSFIGYFIRNWHHQMIVFTVTPLIFVFFFYWLLPTSNAWLFAKVFKILFLIWDMTKQSYKFRDYFLCIFRVRQSAKKVMSIGKVRVKIKARTKS